ncbi:TadE family type IV pilus minor pilin, partial [Streptomyces sp. NPDC059104]|uniref:TadE family type IV pilus minor pilin n=1 Tax=Streptomyces sp. NPDC059104 TaxID=3346729 RepID=UPI00368DB4A3
MTAEAALIIPALVLFAALLVWALMAAAAQIRCVDAARAGATASWPMRTDPGGSRGLDDYFTRDYARNIGAEIMGRNKFG